MLNQTIHAQVSVHDVMPHTLERVQRLLDLLPQAEYSKISLLVVPGLNWKSGDLEQLQTWQQQGLDLAGHGWLHKARHIKGVYHRLHSFFVSRNVAEHLAFTKSELMVLLHNNHHWFEQHGLGCPSLYVPPAWAMGDLSKLDLQTAPFRFYESTSGLYDSSEKRFQNLPLCGFEADTALRKQTLMLWNRVNLKFSNAGRPLRISLHPYDLEYLLSDELKRLLNSITHFYGVDDIFQSTDLMGPSISNS